MWKGFDFLPNFKVDQIKYLMILRLEKRFKRIICNLNRFSMHVALPG